MIPTPGTPEIMQSLLTLCFLAAFIAMGESLDCPVCNTTTVKDCIGSNQTCPPGYNQCGIILLRKMWPRPKEQTIVKSCTRATDCDDRLAVLNMGDGRTILSKCSSCVGENCKGTTLLFPPKNRQYNMRTCKACYSGDKECSVEVARCRGDENYCSELSGSRDGNPRHGTMRGCANQAFCDSRKILTPVLGFTTLHSDHCWLATENAAAARTVPELLLSVLGLIFSQVLLQHSNLGSLLE